MSTRVPRPVALVAGIALLLAACGPAGPSGSVPAESATPPATPSTAPTRNTTPPPTAGQPPTPGSPSPGTESPTPTAAPALLILRVSSEGGFIAPAASLAAIPTVSVYADGRIITAGPADLMAPGPLLAPIEVRTLDQAGVSAIEAAIRAAGLDEPSTGGPGIPGDTGSTVFAVSLDGTTVTTRLASNGPGGPGRPGGGGGGGGDAGRAAAFDLLGGLLDETRAWGGSVPSAQPYRPSAYRLFVAPGAPPADPGATRAPVAWPLATALDAFGRAAVPDRGIAGLRTGVVLGADAATLAPVLAAATQATAFTSDGKEWTLYVRPLLPDELGG